MTSTGCPAARAQRTVGMSPGEKAHPPRPAHPGAASLSCYPASWHQCVGGATVRGWGPEQVRGSPKDAQHAPCTHSGLTPPLPPPQVQPRLQGGPLPQGHDHRAAAGRRQRRGHLRVGGAGGQPGRRAGHPGGRSDSAGDAGLAPGVQPPPARPPLCPPPRTGDTPCRHLNTLTSLCLRHDPGGWTTTLLIGARLAQGTTLSLSHPGYQCPQPCHPGHALVPFTAVSSTS